MGYKKGSEVLPVHLLKEIQKYIDGALIYIPKKSKKVGWGHLSGSRDSIDKRNNEIYRLYKQGVSLDDLANMFYLSNETIKKIVYSKKQL